MYHFEQFGYWGNLDINIYECGIHDVPPCYVIDETMLRRHNILHFITAGKGTLRIANQSFSLKTGEGFFIPAYTPARYEADKDDPWSYCWIIFDGIKAKNYLQKSHITLKYPVFICADSAFYRDTLAHMMTLNNSPSELSEAQLFSCCYSIFAQVLKDNLNRQVSSSPNFRMDLYIEQAIKYIQTHYQKPLRVKDVASHIGLTPNYFGTIFHLCIGMSPQSYILLLRMHSAVALLLTTHHSVKEIGAMVGYPSPISFVKTFKKHIGVPPLKYRAAPDASNTPIAYRHLQTISLYKANKEEALHDHPDDPNGI